jgi:hypothetical protein
MFMRIVQQVSGRLMALFTTVYSLVQAQLLLLASKLRVSITQAFQSAANQYLLNLLRVPTGSSTSRLAVILITVGQLIKAALINVKASLIRIGLQLLTIARKIKQRVHTLLSQKKDKLVALIKWVRLRLSESKTALILMAHQLIQVGLKLAGHVKQLQQRVLQLLKVKL